MAGNIIGVTSLLITVIGWAAVAYFGMRAYRQQKLLDKRIDAFERTMQILIEFFYNKDWDDNAHVKRITNELRQCHVLIQIYGNETEIRKMSSFLDALETDDNPDKVEKGQALIDEIIKNLRQEVLIKNAEIIRPSKASVSSL